MRKLIYDIATSIDGYIASQDDDVSSFLFEGPHVDDFLERIAAYDVAIMGTGTYEYGLQHGLKLGDIAYPGLKHIIASSSLSFESNDEIELISEGLVEQLEELKRQPGKNLWLVGGGTLAGSLFKHGLIDELILKVNPFVMGNGIRLFEDTEAATGLTLSHQKAYKNGVILQRYTKRA